MLLELRVANFAIIKEVSVEFTNSLNILTGETGAGKSLLIDALLALMGRSGSTFVRTGEEKAIVEAIFSKDKNLFDDIEEAGAEDFISLRKVIMCNGKTRQYLNGNFVTQAKIKGLLQKLLHVYGQHEAKELYDSAYHLELYDIYCGNEALKLELKRLLTTAREIKKELALLEDEAMKRAQEIDYLQFQIKEIENANIKSHDEEDILMVKRNVLQSRDKILRSLNDACEILYSGEHSAFDKLSQAIKILHAISDKEKSVENAIKELSTAAENIKSNAYTFKDLMDSLEASEEDINEIESRLDLLFKLKKKYGKNLMEIQNYAENARKRLEELENLDISKEKLEKDLLDLRNKILDCCNKLSKKRKEFLKKFSHHVESELKDLGMPKALFRVSLVDEKVDFPEEYSYKGAERVEFLFAAHKGEEEKPLNAIASGGELSRIMLAIKNVIPKEHSMTIIFDEVDTGVGGKVGEMLGKKLKEISRHHQVICITHLPQVAIWADNHIKVSKEEKEGRVIVKVKSLNHQERIEEITRMIGGDLTEKGIEYARELIEKVGG